MKADVWGIPGAGGVVEGTARVIFDLANVGEVLPGEILVTPVTDVAWTAGR